MQNQMKTNIFNIIAAGALMVGASSCDGRWTPPTEAEGSVALGSMTVTNDDAEKLIKNEQSRAEEPVSNYIVTMSKDGDTAPYKQWTYSAMPEVVTLPAGNYVVDVISHEVQKAEWERPYFAGSKKFTVEAGRITDIGEVVCKFSSIKVTVQFSNDLRRVMGPDCKVTVLANDQGSLEYTADTDKAGYFEALKGSNTMVVTFNGSLSGTPTSGQFTFNDAEAGQHRIITFKTKNNPDIPEQSGTIDPSEGVSIDASMSNQDIDGNIETEESLIAGYIRPGGAETPKDPVGPTPGGDPAATFTSSTLSLGADKPNTSIPATSIVNIDCPKGFANLLVEIVTTNDNFAASVGELMPMTFDLATVDGDTKISLESIGLPTGDAVVGKTNVDFNITDLAPLLEAFPGTHTFKLSVTDAEGGKSSLELVFVI